MPRRPVVARRAVVVGAGSFGTAIAVLLARGGYRTTLQCRTTEQAERLRADRENVQYLSGVELPEELKVTDLEDGLARAELVFLGVPSSGLDDVIAQLEGRGLPRGAKLISMAKGLVPPHGRPPSLVLRERFGERRVAVLGGPAHAREMVHDGAGLVAAAFDPELGAMLQRVFVRAGVVCELSEDPVGVELAGAAKNAAALAAGATEGQGLNAAGAAAGHIFAEVWDLALGEGARPESFIGLAGTGDLVATALAPMSRNRRAGELLAQGVPAAEIPERIGQAVEALESVPLLAEALQRTGVHAPVTSGLKHLIDGDVPLDEWVSLVRTTVPVTKRWRPPRGFWDRMRTRVRTFFSRPAAPREPVALLARGTDE
jgi:glycerol-3-phosphate dehydrogenase (NAD(P)+)